MNAQEKFKVITTIVVGFLALFFIFNIDVFIIIALVIGVGSLFFDFFLNGTVWFWTKITLLLGWVNSRILLSIIFYIILFPIALLYKLFSKDPLELKDSKESLYNERSHAYDKTDFENVW